MGTTALVSDSSCSLTAREAAALGVGLVPLHVTLRDRRAPEPEIDPRDFYARLRAGDTATTSQPSPEEFLTAFAAAAAGGAEHVLCLTCASTMSGTHASALLAAGLAEVAVDVIDSGTISGGLRLLVVEASRALAAGESGEEVLALVTSLTGRVRSTWSADSPALLAGGGHLAADVPDGVALLGLDGEVVVLGSARPWRSRCAGRRSSSGPPRPARRPGSPSVTETRPTSPTRSPLPSRARPACSRSIGTSWAPPSAPTPGRAASAPAT